MLLVVSDPSLTKYGVYWSWNKAFASFEDQLSQEASGVEKARKVWEVNGKKKKIMENWGFNQLIKVKKRRMAMKKEIETEGSSKLMDFLCLLEGHKSNIS